MTQGLVHIIRNPISGSGRPPGFLSELVHHLSLRGFPVRVSETAGPGDARRLASETPDDARCIISVGGDGTHREVLSGLVGRPVPVCPSPSGTENVLGRTLGLSGTLHETVDTVQRGRTIALDMAMANGRPFVMFSGVGFDAAVTQEVHRRRHGHISRSAYYGVILRMWWRYGFPPMTVKVDGRLITDDAGVVFVANTPLYADHLRIAPRAVGDDGRLDVVCFRTRERWQMLRHFVRAKLGRHLDRPLVAYAQGRTIEITSPERPLPVQTDGDACAETPVTYTVAPKAVRLLVPAADFAKTRA
jgi:diacylglycerol kinase (ATP)